MTNESFTLIPDGATFAHGITPNIPEGIHLKDERLGDLLLWVAKKGNAGDWAIYYDWKEKGIVGVAHEGLKVTREEFIRQLVPCDDTLLKKYRY